MSPTRRTKAQLIEENEALRAKVAELERAPEHEGEGRALRESEARYRRLFEDAPIGIGLATLDGKVVAVNKAMLSIMGHSLESLKTLKLADTYQKPEDRTALLAALGQDGHVEGFRVGLVRRDGTPYDALLYVSKIRMNERDLYQTMCMDLTRRKRVREALKRAEREKATILDSISETLFYRDMDHRVIWANRAAAQVIGAPAESLVGRRCYEVWWDRDEPCEGCFAVAAVETGHSQEKEVTRPDGRSLRVRVDPVWDAAGQIVGLIEMGEDITEHKRAEQALRESEEMLRLVTERASDGINICEFDPVTLRRRLVFCNDRYVQMSGYSREELAACEDLNQLVVQHHTDEELEEHYACILNGVPFGGTASWKRPDGEENTYEWSAASVKRGETYHIIGLDRDITERKQVEGALRESEELFRLVVENAFEGISISEFDPVTHKRRLVFCNDQYVEMSGYTREELMAADDLNQLATAHHTPEELREQHEHVIEERRVSGTASWNRPDGKENTYEFHSASTRRNGRYCIVGVDRDITERKRAEESLRESEELLRAVINADPNCIFLKDDNGRYLVVNEAVAALHSTTPEYMLRKTDADYLDNSLTTPEQVERFRRDDQDIIARERPRFIPQESFALPDGTTRWFQTNKVPVFVEGKGTCVLGVAVDITERRKAEEALRESEERYRALFEQAADAVVVVDAQTGELLEFNDRAHEQLGYTRDEFQKLTIADIEVIESPEEVVGHLEKIVKRGRGAFETKQRAEDGQVRDVLVTSRAISIGQKPLIQSIWRDITERKQAEVALRESEERYRGLIEMMNEGLAVLDENRRLTFANNRLCEMLGGAREELIGLPVDVLMDDANRRVLREQFARRREGARNRYEVTLKRKDGGEVFALVSPRPIFDAEGRFAGSMATLTDLTERRHAERAQQEAEREKVTILDSMSELLAYQDPEGTVLWANRAAAQSLGTSPENLIGKRCYELWQGRDERCAGCPVLRAMRTGRLEDGEITSADGRVWHVRGDPVRDAEGRVVGAVETTFDITERKRAEDTLRGQRDLAVTLSRVTSLEEGLRATLDAAVEVSGMDCGGIYLVDPASGEVHLACHRGLSDGFVSAAAHYDADSANARLVTAGEPAYGQQREAALPLSEAERREGLRALAVIPIQHEGRVVGCLNVASHTVDEVAAWRRQALETIAVGIGSAIASLRAEQALRESEEFNRALFDYNPMQTVIVDREGRITDFNMAKRQADSRLPNTGDVMYGDYASRHRIDMHAELMQCIETGELREFAEMPYGDRFLAITIAPFPQGAIIISRDITGEKESERKLKDSRTQLRALAARVTSVREEEREELAREIHDELGHALTALKMDVAWLRRRLLAPDAKLTASSAEEHMDGMAAMLDQTIERVRKLATELRPGVLDLGLIKAVEWQAQDFQERTGIRCKIVATPGSVILERERSAAAFRIFQELLFNVARHAEATAVQVSIQARGGVLTVGVRDNGRGITQREVSDPKSLGLIGMRERALAFGGEVEIEGTPGKGTAVTVRIPMVG